MLDDDELAAQAAEGDLDAFGRLFTRYARDVYRLALSLGHRKADAEDLMQDTFVAAMEGVARFERRASVRTWLTSILIRQASRRRRYLSLRVTEVLDESGHPAEQRASQKQEQRLDVQAMLDSLSPDHRTVLMLRELQGLSYDEIAAMLHIPRGTVESRLFRARNLLRERFQEYQSTRPLPRVAEPGAAAESRHE